MNAHIVQAAATNWLTTGVQFEQMGSGIVQDLSAFGMKNVVKVSAIMEPHLGQRWSGIRHMSIIARMYGPKGPHLKGEYKFPDSSRVE